jgi:hypothetical protein
MKLYFKNIEIYRNISIYSQLPPISCAVDFIVESSENILMAANAALRYQPTSLSAEQIADMVFNASLANMNDEQREAAIEARGEAQAAAQSARQNSNTGITGLLTGPQGGQRMGGGGRQGQGAQQGQGSGSRNTVVMRNLWFINGEGKLDVIQVRTGISDGSFTEIFTAEELEGREFILRERL